jgi:DNA phosphorothioation-dependent restriction protein DptG
MNQKIELTEEEWEHLKVLFDMLENWYAEKGPWLNSSPLEKALDKIHAALQPEYKPSVHEIQKLRELSGAGFHDSRDVLIRFRGDMEAANEYLKTKRRA